MVFVVVSWSSFCLQYVVPGCDETMTWPFHHVCWRVPSPMACWLHTGPWHHAFIVCLLHFVGHFRARCATRWSNAIRHLNATLIGLSHDGTITYHHMIARIIFRQSYDWYPDGRSPLLVSSHDVTRWHCHRMVWGLFGHLIWCNDQSLLIFTASMSTH